tara:strand:- start:8669 stop:9277 length:609 start_codon:yes stop_codon:yes gene_type:complete
MNEELNEVPRYAIDNDTGIWSGKEKHLRGHREDEQLKQAVVDVFNKKNIKTVYDFGCGLGGYTKFLNNNNIYTEGYDGNPDTPILSNGMCKVLDLSKKFNLGKQMDYVFCLEVGEHIPQKYESTFIDNLHRHNKKGMILSWATNNPYQGGHGHVNNLDNVYIINRLNKLGYKHDTETEIYLKENLDSVSFGYFLTSLMAFVK